MVLDPLAQQVGVGGIFALLAIGLVMKLLPGMMAAMRRTDGNGPKKGNSAGDKSPEWWIAENGRIIQEALKAHDSFRNEAIRNLLQEELDNWSAKRNEELRRVVGETVKSLHDRLDRWSKEQH
jgi:hypothetical protein